MARSTSTKRTAVWVLVLAVGASLVWWGATAVGGDESGSTTTTLPDEATPSTELVIDDVDGLAAAIGCDELEVADFVAAPPAATSHYCHFARGPKAILHTTDSAADHTELVAYVTADALWLDGHRETVPRDLWVVAGDTWVASTHEEDRAREIAAAARGEVVTAEPIGPPASYQ